MLTRGRCEVSVAALCCPHCQLLSWAAQSFGGTVRTMCHSFPLEKSRWFRSSLTQVSLVLPRQKTL